MAVVKDWAGGWTEVIPQPALVKSPQLRRTFERVIAAINALSIFAGFGAALAIAAIFLLMLYEIISRVFGTPTPFSWEYCSYLMCIGFFWAAGMTLLGGGHVRVAMIVETGSAFRRYVFELLATAFGTIVTGLMAFAIARAAWDHAMRGAKSFTVMETPLAVPIGLAAFGAIVLALQFLARFLALSIGQDQRHHIAGEEESSAE